MLGETPGNSKTPDEHNRRRLLLWLVAVVVASILAYLPTLRFGFTLDDVLLVDRSPITQSLRSAPSAFLVEFAPKHLNPLLPYYRPLVTLSHQANHTLFGRSPLSFHAANILLHALVVALVFLMARHLTRSTGAAGVAGLVFAVLPSHAESVAWISGRTDLLATFFSLACFAAFAANYRPRPRFSPRLGLLCSLLFLCALLSKENALILPLLFAGYAWVFGGSMRRGKFAGWVLLLLPPVLIYLLLRHHVLGVALGHQMLYGLGQRLLGVGVMYTVYLRMLFVPLHPRIVYDLYPFIAGHPAIDLLAWLVPLGMTALAVWSRRRAPIVSFGVLWILVTLLPVVNLIPTFAPLPAERFVYLSSVGSSAILGWGVYQLCLWRTKSGIARPAAIALTCAFLLYSSAQAISGSRMYESNLTWARAVATSGTHFTSYLTDAAGVLANAGCYSEAAALYKRAEQPAPGVK